MAEAVITGENKNTNPWIIMIPVMLTIFMFALDETISNVALPYMAGTFSISHNESTWIITSYLVASGIVIPTVDFFSKLMGRKAYFLLSVAIFTIASVLCGLATSMPMMLFGRILQGISIIASIFFVGICRNIPLLCSCNNCCNPACPAD